MSPACAPPTSYTNSKNKYQRPDLYWLALLLALLASLLCPLGATAPLVRKIHSCSASGQRLRSMGPPTCQCVFSHVLRWSMPHCRTKLEAALGAPKGLNEIRLDCLNWICPRRPECCLAAFLRLRARTLAPPQSKLCVDLVRHYWPTNNLATF